MRGLARPLLIVSLLFLAASADARAAAWLPLAPATDGTTTVTEPSVAVDDAGNVYAAWVQNGALAVSRRPVGGAFETPQLIEPDPSSTVSNPDIAVDGAGNAMVVWTLTPQSGTVTIRQARRAAGAATFGASTIVPGNATGSRVPALAINRAGQAVLAVDRTFNTSAVVATFVGSSTSDFGMPQTTYDEANGTTFQPAVAINEAGDAVVAYRAIAASNPVIRGGFRARGATAFGTPRDPVVSDPTQKRDPDVAIDSDGNAMTVWDEGSTGQINAALRPAGAPAGVSWQQQPDLDNPASNGLEPQVEFRVDRFALAAWGADGAVRGATRPPGGVFGAPDSLTPAAEEPFDLALDAGGGFEGTTALTWAAGINPSVVRAARNPFSSLSVTSTLSPAGRGGHSTDVAVDPIGNAAAVWVDTDEAGSNQRIVTAEYDRTVPTLEASVPETAEPGKTVAMSATSTDDWSQPTVSWDFGDEETATGNAVTHSFAASGTYDVTVLATDAAGNTFSFSRPVAVGPPPAGDLPSIGEDFNASSVSGTVLVSTPAPAPVPKRAPRRAAAHSAAAVIRPPTGYLPFRTLGKDESIPVGAIFDASKGKARITMATNLAGTTQQTGTISKGAFKTSQGKTRPLTTLTMMGGGNFKRCVSRRRARKGGVWAAARRRPSRRLFSNVKGRFRTRGRNSTATVRGTRYLVKDTCAGTLTRVTSGRVAVRDLVKNRTRTVRAGRSYLARVPRKQGRRG